MTKDEALTLALEALEPFSTPSWAGAGVDKANEAIIVIKEALAQPVQEPDLTAAYMSGLHDGKKKRPWVGLTDDELAALSASGLALWSLWRAIEQALKKKNT